jgi:phosphate transport system permease protein
VVVAWPDGHLARYNTRDFSRPYLQEELDLFEGDDIELTSMTWLLGRTTLIAGDSQGFIHGLFPARAEGSEDQRLYLVRGHRVKLADSAITALATSSRSRMIAAGSDDGKVELFYITSRKELGSVVASPEGAGVMVVAFAPKDNGLLAISGEGLAYWKLDPGHPETTLAALFAPMWYEGASKPEFVWQSTGGTDSFESKLGLWPLIFGTLKATIYSLLFGVPIALLAAVFTSEFLSPRVRVRIKPVVELMASLPSVVLGFLAALVFAPVVADSLSVFLALLLTVPVSFLTGSYVWQLLPHRITLKYRRWRFFAMFLVMPLGILGGVVFGPVLEFLSFGGDIMLWLDGQIAGTSGAWALLLFPLNVLALAMVYGRVLSPMVRRLTMDWSRTRCAWFDLGKFAAGLAAAIVLSGLGGALLNLLGLDPRGGMFDTYVQRNSLVVGFIMGFAIIPIIYTISEDALSAVPEHLRSASLGAGATPWQTATRIIIPTAMSGLFSAVMIGLGRAVGETMIVLMAAGNTPIMEWNIFNGFRTLSANIAVELPEAVVGSTHYRILFLAALVLFVMTFVLNTAAEIVRLRFRKRASEL